jgi:hypothetical protein
MLEVVAVPLVVQPKGRLVMEVPVAAALGSVDQKHRHLMALLIEEAGVEQLLILIHVLEMEVRV